MAAAGAKKDQPKKKMSVQVSKKRQRESKGNKDAKQQKAKPLSAAVEETEEESEQASEQESGSASASASEAEEEEVEVEEDEEDDDDIPTVQKKQKKSAKKEAESFSNAMNALLDTRLKAYDRKDPILARSKKELKKFEDVKLEQKAKHLLLTEKKKKLTANRNKDLLPKNDATARQVLQHEKQLKKTAQRGVIKLFNAILMTQTSTESDMSHETGLVGQSKKKELVNEISKEKFLDLVQQVGKK